MAILVVAAGAKPARSTSFPLVRLTPKEVGLDLFMADSWTGSHMAEWLSLIMYALLIWYFVRSVMKRKD